MSIMITGGSKGIGRALTQRLSQNETIYNVSRTPSKILNVIDLQCDITDEESVKSLFSRYKPTTIYHFAGNPIVNSPPDDLIKTNLLGTHNLLKYCPEGTRFVYASSITVYGTSIEPLDEYSLALPTSVYAVSKLSSEHLITCYNELRNIDSLILRLGATIGISQHGLIPDIIRKLKNEKLELLGKCPGSSKPITYIEDVINAILHLSNESGVFNVCNSGYISVRQVARTIMEYLQIEKEIIWLDQNWKGDNQYLNCSNRKLLNTEFTFQYSSKGAIREYLRRYNVT